MADARGGPRRPGGADNKKPRIVRGFHWCGAEARVDCNAVITAAA